MSKLVMVRIGNRVNQELVKNDECNSAFQVLSTGRCYKIIRVCKCAGTLL